MRFLVLSFYYPPDLSAGSFRTRAFVDSLNKKIRETDTIDVITTCPNRYHSYNAESSPNQDEKKNVRVFRIDIPRHKNGFTDQCKSFAVFFYKAIKIIRHEKYDAVYATSSRLFTAVLGAIVSKWKKTALYLDIRDIFLDTLASIFSGYLRRLVIPVIDCFEHFTMRSANKINLVSYGFASYFQKKYPDVPLSFFSNGIDQEFENFNFDSKEKNTKRVVTYAGNIGEGQGLETIIPKMAKSCPHFLFLVVGDGGTKSKLIYALSGINNVKIISPVPRVELLELYRKSDYLFLHLNDYPAFKKVLPSKIFEYGATGKPIIAGVGGYAKKFLEENLPDSIVFNPGDVNDFMLQFSSSGEPTQKDRRAFSTKYSRSTIMANLTEDFLKTVRC